MLSYRSCAKLPLNIKYKTGQVKGRYFGVEVSSVIEAGKLPPFLAKALGCAVPLEGGGGGQERGGEGGEEKEESKDESQDLRPLRAVMLGLERCFFFFW